MTLIRNMANVEKIHYANLVIGYFHGKAIIRNESSDLYYLECEEQIAPVGTVIESDGLFSIKLLPEKERSEIIDIYM